MYIPRIRFAWVMVTYKEPLDNYLNRLINAVVHVGNELTRIGNILMDDETAAERHEETNLALMTIAEQVENLVEVVEGGQ